MVIITDNTLDENVCIKMNGWMRSTQRVLCDSIAASLKRDGTCQAVFPHHFAVDTSMQNGILSGLYGVMVRWMHQKKQANEVRGCISCHMVSSHIGVPTPTWVSSSGWTATVL